MKNIILGFCFFQSIFFYGQSDLKTKKTIQDIGDVAQFAPIAASLVMTIIKKDKKGVWQLTKATALDMAVTYAVKYAIDKPRPEGTDGHAFPSGHTSIAFVGAAFLQKRYGWAYGIPAYVVSGFVGYSRIKGFYHRHDEWDVLGGIIVGVSSAYLFTTPYQKEHFELSFNKEKETYLLGLQYKF